MYARLTAESLLVQDTHVKSVTESELNKITALETPSSVVWQFLKCHTHTH
jgi:hypothetical protein